MSRPMAEEEMANLLERYGNIQAEFEHRGGYDLESRAQVILTGLGIGPDEYHQPWRRSAGAGRCGLPWPRSCRSIRRPLAG